MRRGSVTKRGKSSWRIKFETGTNAAGERITQYQTVHGTRRDAETVLAKRLTELAEGGFVRPTTETVGSYADHWITNIAPAARSRQTVVQYRTLVNAHIIPGLGSIALQKLDGSTIDRFYQSRREMGLAPLTILHIHAVLKQILTSAVRAKKLTRSPITDIETKPKPTRRDKMLDEPELAALLDALKSHWIYGPTLLSASTGLRRSEVCGLRWQDVDLKKGTLQVVQAAKVISGKLHIEIPKTARSARTIKMPLALASELERHRREQLEQRLKLGLGGRPAYVFTSPVGEVLNPKSLTEVFANKVAEAGLKPIHFHGLRHTHITLLLKSGVPVHVVSARAGHAKPSITLDTYSHLLGGEDNDAAKQAEEILRRVLK